MTISYIEMEQLKKDIIYFLEYEMIKRNYDGLHGLIGLETFDFDFTQLLENKLTELSIVH